MTFAEIKKKKRFGPMPLGSRNDLDKGEDEKYNKKMLTYLLKGGRNFRWRCCYAIH